MRPEPESPDEVIPELQPHHPVLTPPALEPLWTAAELSAAFKIAKTTVYTWVQQARIPHLRLGSCIRFRPREVHAWLERHAIQDSPAKEP